MIIRWQNIFIFEEKSWTFHFKWNILMVSVYPTYSKALIYFILCLAEPLGVGIFFAKKSSILAASYNINPMILLNILKDSYSRALPRRYNPLYTASVTLYHTDVQGHHSLHLKWLYLYHMSLWLLYVWNMFSPHNQGLCDTGIPCCYLPLPRQCLQCIHVHFHLQIRSSIVSGVYELIVLTDFSWASHRRNKNKSNCKRK